MDVLVHTLSPDGTLELRDPKKKKKFQDVGEKQC
jgi:hypothetical protein